MARTYARLLLSIWRDPDFVALSHDAQWLYLALISQDTISWAGVQGVTLNRWAGLSSTLTAADVGGALRELEAERFVLVDHRTEEVLVRTFARHSLITRNSKLLTAARRAVGRILSPTLREYAEAALGQGDPENPPPGADEDDWGGYRGEAAYEGASHGASQAPSDGASQAACEGASHVSLSPSNLFLSSSDQKTQAGVGTNQDDEGGHRDPGVVRSALDDLARRDLTAAEARGTPIGDRARYLQACYHRRLMACGPEVEQLHAEHPDWPPQRIAEAVTWSPARLPEYEPEGLFTGTKPDMAAIRDIARRSS